MSNVAFANLPTPKLERWKYTNLPPALKGLPAETGEADIVCKSGGKFVQNYGITGDNVPAWVRGVPAQSPAGAKHYHDMALWEMNNEHLQDVVVVDVPAGKAVDKAVKLVMTGYAAKIFMPRIIVRLGDGAEATLIEDHKGAGHFWNNAVTQIIIGKNARLRHVRVQDNGAEAVYTQNTHVTVDCDGAYEALTLTTGSALSRNQIAVELKAENASCRLFGVNLLSGTQLGDTTIGIDHKSSNCRSEQFYRSVLEDQARGVFQGKVYVADGAKGTDARQLSNALLLSEGAEMDTKPELEIYDEDVKCSHGATTGQIDDNALFYLRSRGVPEKEARDLLVRAFVDEVVDKFGDEAVKALIGKALENPPSHSWEGEQRGAG